MHQLKYRLVESTQINGYKYDLQFGTVLSNGEVYWHTFLLFMHENDAIAALDDLNRQTA